MPFYFKETMSVVQRPMQPQGASQHRGMTLHSLFIQSEEGGRRSKLTSSSKGEKERRKREMIPIYWHLTFSSFCGKRDA